MIPVATAGLLPSKRFIGSFQGIAPSNAGSQTVTLQVQPAWNFVDPWFVFTNVTAAMIAEFRLKIGGNIVQRWLGADLDAMNQYDKLPAVSVNNVFRIPLRRMGLRGGAQIFSGGPTPSFVSGSPRDLAYETTLNTGSDGTAGGTVPGYAAIKDVTMEFDLINTTSSQPAIQLYCRVTPPVPGGPGSVRRFDKQALLISSGQVQITKSQMGLDALRPYLNRIILVNPDPDNITLDNFQLRYGTNDWWTISTKLLAQGAQEDALRVTAIPNYYVLDFQEEGWGDTFLDLSAANSDILLTFTAAGVAALNNMTYYIDTLGLPYSANR